MLYIARENLDRAVNNILNILGELSNEGGLRVIEMQRIKREDVQNHIFGMICALTGYNALPSDTRDISGILHNPIGIYPKKKDSEFFSTEVKKKK